MAVTPLEILDTAVKVGLGAVITGLITYVTADANHKRETAKDWRKKKWEALERIAERAEEFSHSALKYWAHITEWGSYQNRGQDMPEDRVKKVELTREELFHSFKNLSAVESHLLLLGATEAQKLCREYGELVTRFSRIAYIGGSPLTQESSAKWRADILSSRQCLFNNLNKIYIGDGG